MNCKQKKPFETQPALEAGNLVPLGADWYGDGWFGKADMAVRGCLEFHEFDIV